MKNSATTSAANCVCWRRRAALCVRLRSFPALSWQAFIAICFYAAGALVATGAERMAEVIELLR